MPFRERPPKSFHGGGSPRFAQTICRKDNVVQGDWPRTQPDGGKGIGQFETLQSDRIAYLEETSLLEPGHNLLTSLCSDENHCVSDLKTGKMRCKRPVQTNQRNGQYIHPGAEKKEVRVMHFT